MEKIDISSIILFSSLFYCWGCDLKSSIHNTVVLRPVVWQTLESVKMSQILWHNKYSLLTRKKIKITGFILIIGSKKKWEFIHLSKHTQFRIEINLKNLNITVGIWYGSKKNEISSRKHCLAFCVCFPGAYYGFSFFKTEMHLKWENKEYFRGLCKSILLHLVNR